MEDLSKDAMANPIGTVTTGAEDPRPAVTATIAERHDGLRVHLPYSDLREWLAEAEKLGEARVITGASWQEEIGMAAELALHSDTAPCLVFDEIPGCPKGFRVLTNFFGGRRKNMTLGFPAHLNKLELSEAFLEHYLKDLKRVPVEEVETGPIFENVLMGADVDVTKFPTPVWHERDGGRYIGTGTYSITRDPEENWLNAGAYRAQVHDKTSVGIGWLSAWYLSR